MMTTVDKTTTRLFVHVDEKYVSSHRHPGDQGSWRDEKESTVTGVSLAETTDSNRGEYITVPTTVQNGDIVYVLFMTYSSGDSYGNSTGNYEMVWVFTDAELAKHALNEVKTINDIRDRRDSNADASIKFMLENGKLQTVHNPVSGYFESMEDVYVQMLVVGHNMKMR